MLELDADHWMRPRNDSTEQSQQQMKQFLQGWLPFDWTQQVWYTHSFGLYQISEYISILTTMLLVIHSLTLSLSYSLTLLLYVCVG